MSASDRRRDPRMGLSVPVRVVGHDQDGTAWEEMTATDDASYGGASFALKHPHGVGQVFSLSLPLPRNFRRYDLAETSYRIFALVRNTRAGSQGERVAGVMFIGRVPPKGYETKPGGRYRLPDDPKTGPGVDRRQHERLQLFVNLRLRRLGVAGALEEQTVTENVSRGGARVFTTLPVASGATLTVADRGDTVAAEALVRNVFAGRDHVMRLNLQFPDESSFERLLHAAGAPPLPGGS
ncbi:MAG TPA: PilZ domain-containing protein [Vicinamibacteria bacterium]|nr:PilZ domain-containing protein [Vicinamibacteria bacterium]